MRLISAIILKPSGRVLVCKVDGAAHFGKLNNLRIF